MAMSLTETKAKKMLGHSSVVKTQTYVKTSQEEIVLAHKRYIV